MELVRRQGAENHDFPQSPDLRPQADLRCSLRAGAFSATLSRFALCNFRDTGLLRLFSIRAVQDRASLTADAKFSEAQNVPTCTCTGSELPALSSDSTANLMEGDRARFWRGRRRSMSRSGIESSTRVAQVPNSHFLEDRCTSLLVLMGEMSGPWRLGNAATCCRHPDEAPAGTDALFAADDLQEACHRTACNQGRRLVISHALSSPFFRCFKPGTHCPNVSFCIRDRPPVVIFICKGYSMHRLAKQLCLQLQLLSSATSAAVDYMHCPV